MKNTCSYIASYTGLQTIITARRGQIHPLAPKMYPSEEWRVRSGNLQLEYNGQNLIAQLIMDDGTYSSICINDITPTQAQLALQQKTLLLEYVAQDVQFTGPAKKSTKKKYNTFYRPNTTDGNNTTKKKESKPNPHSTKTTQTTDHPNTSETQEDSENPEITIPRTTTLYTLQLAGIFIGEKVIKGQKYIAQSPSPTDYQTTLPPIQRYGSLHYSSSHNLEQHVTTTPSASIVLHDPATTFLNQTHSYQLLDHEGEIILGRRKEVEKGKMQQALNAIITLQFNYNADLQQFFSNIYTLLHNAKEKLATGKLTENQEMQQYASIREYFPFEKEQASSLIDKYTSSLEELINATQDTSRLSAFNVLPWQEEKVTQIVAICTDYSSDFLKLNHSPSSKKSRQDQYTRLVESKHLLAEYTNAKNNFLEVINTFVLKNTRLIPKIATSYTRKGFDRGDALQYGMFGLRRAAIKYDWKRGYKFSTYATWWIRQELQRSTQEESSLIRLPVHMHDTKNKISHFNTEFWKLECREPTPQEIATGLKIPLAKVKLLLAQKDHLKSLDEKVGESQESSLLDLIDGSNEFVLSDHLHIPPSPEKVVMQTEDADNIHKRLKKLHPREEKILKLRFGFHDKEELTLEQVGQQFSLTRERIRQIENGALKKLEKTLQRPDYRPPQKKIKKQPEQEGSEEQEVA